MWYVYFLKSSKKEAWCYVGSTNNLARRYDEHKKGLAISTKPYIPLYLKAYIAVDSKDKALSLEEYFKKGSGKAILKKRILNDEALA